MRSLLSIIRILFTMRMRGKMTSILFAPIIRIELALFICQG